MSINVVRQREQRNLVSRSLRASLFVVICGICLVVTSSCVFAQEACANYASEWTLVERWVWGRICHGLLVNLYSYGMDAEIDPQENIPKTGANRRNISSEFVRTVLTQTPYKERIRSVGLQIIYAVFDDAFVLRDLSIDAPLLRLCCTFESNVDLSRGRFTGTVSFVGSTLQGGINLEDAQISGSLFLGQTNLERALDLTLHQNADPPVIQFIHAKGLQVSGDTTIYRAVINKDVSFERVRARGMFDLHRVDAHEVSLVSGDFANQLVIVESKLSPGKQENEIDVNSYSVLNLYSITAHQTVFLNRSEILNSTNLDSARIDGSLILYGTHLGSVRAENVSIKGGLLIGAVGQSSELKGKNTSWLPETQLDLSNAIVGYVHTPFDLNVWPGKLTLTNFSTTAFHFDELKPNVAKMPSHDTPDLPPFFAFDLFYQPIAPVYDAQVRSDKSIWFKEWLHRQATFSPQPYSQVRKLLLGTGEEEAAAEVGYAERDRELYESIVKGQTINATYLLFSKATIGYGYQMWLPLIWLMAFVSVGAFLFSRTPESRLECMPYGLAYSFDTFLPLIRLRERHYEIDIQGNARYYFYIHRLAGWLLGSFIVAGLSGFTK